MKRLSHLCAALILIVLAAGQAEADTYTLTATGIISSDGNYDGKDNLGLFGAANNSLIGQSVTFTQIFDSVLLTKSGGTNSSVISGNPSAISAFVSIGGVTWSDPTMIQGTYQSLTLEDYLSAKAFTYDMIQGKSEANNGALKFTGLVNMQCEFTGCVPSLDFSQTLNVNSNSIFAFGYGQLDWNSAEGADHLYFQVDNISLNPATVPEPNTFVLLFLGLGFARFIARRWTGGGNLG